MIPYEEYGKDKYDEDDSYEKLPVSAIVAIIVLCSLIGLFIVCAAIYGLPGYACLRHPPDALDCPGVVCLGVCGAEQHLLLARID